MGCEDEETCRHGCLPVLTSRKPRGRHPHHRLTAVGVRNMRKPGRYADGNGLYLFVDRAGAKRWVLRTLIHGKRCDLGLGSVDLVPLTDARSEAARLRRRAREGGDPLAERRRGHGHVATFTEAASEYHATHSTIFRNKKHAAQWLSSLAMYAFPVIGNRPVQTVTSSDVLRVLTPIWAVKAETASRVRQRLDVVFRWAKASGYYMGDNPVDGVKDVLKKVPREVRHHAALPYGELPSFLEALRAATDVNEVTKLALELLILTASRTSELRLAEWPEIDRVTCIWTRPAQHMKWKRTHRVPLSPRCLEILDRAAELSDGGPYIFPGRKPQTPLSDMALLQVVRRLEKTAGVPHCVPHGFRSTFRDWAAERRFDRDAAEAALAHKIKDKTEAAYFRSDLLEERRKLMAAWEAFATGRLADVVPLRA